MGSKKRQKNDSNRLRRQRNREQAGDAIRAKLDPVREKYAQNWAEGHATLFKNEGHYQWMAEFVKGRRLVLEIGTGDGAGTLALVANGSVVVSVDHNPFCLERAKQNLETAGVPVVYEARENIVANDDKSYEITFPKVNAALPSSWVLLLGGNILTDNELDRWLWNMPEAFDAMVCWNIGTFQLNSTLTKSTSDYRLLIQNRAFERANRLLKPGGILHIVDRGRDLIPGREQEMYDALINGFEDQASVTTLKVSKDIKVRSFVPPAEGTGISLKPASTEVFEHDENKMGLWSIIATRP